MKKEEVYQHWFDMPEYDNIKEEEPKILVAFKFKTEEDFSLFNDLLKKYVYKCNKVFDGRQTKTKKQAWFPLKEKATKYEYK